MARSKGLFGFERKKGSSWDQIQSNGSNHFRDVYEDQQLGRSELGKVRSTNPVRIIAIVVGFIAYLLFWVMFSFVSMGRDALTQFTDAGGATSKVHLKGVSDYIFAFGFLKFLGAVLCALVVWAMVHIQLVKMVKTQNIQASPDELLQNKDDAFIQPPAMILHNYAFFPNLGAHSAVSPTSLISHQHATNKGVNKVMVAKRSPETVYDEDGDVVVYEGEELRDDNGELIMESVPLIDEKKGQDLFTASGLPKDSEYRRTFNPSDADYNKGGRNIEKLVNGKAYDTVADLMNDEWELPWYEPQRPTGGYVVDTSPVNTMVLAITRAGKGQTIIEPTIDMWLREKRPSNIVVNDPKGELLVKFYVRAARRGYQVVQFNLITPTKTNIYNPLGLAANAAREGDFGKCAAYVEDISEVFFPVDGDSEPMWSNAAANAFKRSAYGMIDYYLEEERELRGRAAQEGMDLDVLEQKIDQMWGRVTLYNCYQFFVQLSSKKMRSPLAIIGEKMEASVRQQNYPGWSDEQLTELLERAKTESELWNGESEMDMMSLFFEATARLPRNDSRSRVLDAHNSLVSMAGSDKMIASVYGIAVTAMSFFTDPTISRLTSGPPSQNTDLASLSFPRRFGVRFDPNFVKRYSLAGLQASWDAFEDAEFTKPLGDEFSHNDTVTAEGWARYYFDGKFKDEVGYVRLRLMNARTHLINHEFYFQFKKGYQTTLNGRSIVRDPITNERIVRDGLLMELTPVDVDGKRTFVPVHTTFKTERLVNIQSDKPEKAMVDVPVVISTSARYSEQPKIVFLVTPPHLMKYAKLILILLRQLVNLNFDQSYTTKENQKPLYKTRFMLDELGNLQSEGHGISGFETMLSIGLGQDQQFTLILQTLAQLLAVYGEGVDKIVQGNVSNIVYLKSTDDQMINTLSTMSGERERVRRSGRSITRNTSKMMNQNDATITYTDSSETGATLSYNNFAHIGRCQSIVFCAGDMPIWNRNETILPMSFKLFGGRAENTIVHYGHTYSFRTVPTLSEAAGFDILQNQPDFLAMYRKRMSDGWSAEKARRLYMNAYDYDDFSILKADGNVVSSEIMEIINVMGYVTSQDQSLPEGADVVTGGSEDGLPDGAANRERGTRVMDAAEGLIDNPEFTESVNRAIAEQKLMEIPLYAGRRLSKDSLVSKSGISHQFDALIIESFVTTRPFFEKDNTFELRDGSLYLRRDGSLLIEMVSASENFKALQESSKNPESRVFMSGGDEETPDELHPEFNVTNSMYRFLVSMDSWTFAEGRFETEMAARMARQESLAVPA